MRVSVTNPIHLAGVDTVALDGETVKNVVAADDQTGRITAIRNIGDTLPESLAAKRTGARDQFNSNGGITDEFQGTVVITLRDGFIVDGAGEIRRDV